MEKVLITIYVLSLDEEYDMFLPIGIKMIDALNLIQQTVKDLSNNIYDINPSAVLYNDDGLLINLNNTAKFSGLKNGCKILLK